MPSREQICKSAAQKLSAAAPQLGSVKATVGFDGFVDEIIAVVDKRHDFERFDSVRTISVFGGKIVAAAGQSSNYELIVKQMKLGGNGPIMANALASAGLGVTYVGNVGYPNVHPVFQEFSQRASVITIGEPGHTDALEFDDGKLMLGKITSMNDVNWDNLVSRVGGEEKLKKLMGDATLIATVNWTMIPHMSQIWGKLLDRGFFSRDGQQRILFVDLADPEKRNHNDIREAMQILSKFQSQVDVILGLNLKEAGEICQVLGISMDGDPEKMIEPTARAIREKLNLHCVVVHPRRGAAAATSEGSASFDGPFIEQPKISTGAGDHFNAGFCLGRVLGFTLDESLCTGCGTSGYYVRTAHSPSAVELAEFVRNLPAPQQAQAAWALAEVQMPLELELKVKVQEFDAVRKALAASGAKHIGAVLETNSFFDTPDKSLLTQDKGLRLRRTRDHRTGEEHFVITVKGPAQPGPFKSREEAETDVDEGGRAAAVLQALGFFPELSFEKRRESWTLDGCKIELDELPILGRFVEVEGPDEPTVQRVRERLGLLSLPSIKTGYISMLSRHLQETGDPRTSITF